MYRAIEWKDYNTIDVILWTFGLFLSVVSILYSILAYHFSSKSTKLLQEHIKKTWLIAETDKFFFNNMKLLKRSCTSTIVHLKEIKEMTYEKYALISSGTRVIHINKESVEIFKSTKFKEIVEYYQQEKEKFDVMFFESIDINKITSFSKEIIPPETIKKLIEYNNSVQIFSSEILKMFTQLTI